MNLTGTSLCVFEYDHERPFVVNDEMVEQFHRTGFIIVRNLFSAKEVGLLREVVDDRSSNLMKHVYYQPDGDGGEIKMIVWNQPGNDITGLMGRSRRIVNTCEKLLGGEVYHYHSKMILKEAYTGGTFHWHQDYGYWYLNGVLAPDLISVQLSVDASNRTNGGLKVIRGSHLLGRVEHKKIGHEAGASTERVNQILNRTAYSRLAGQSRAALLCLAHRFHIFLTHRRRIVDSVLPLPYYMD